MAESKSSGTDTVVKIVLIFFISLLSFSIGTFVGKKFSDNQHKLMALEPQKKNLKEDAESLASNEAAEESSKHEEATVSAHSEESATLSEEELASTEESMTHGEEKALDEEKTEFPSESKAKPEKSIARQIASTESANFTIQVASFPTAKEAIEQVNKLKAQKFEAFHTEANIKGHSWYRVNVGMFNTLKEAREKKASLAEEAKISTSIIQKINK